MKLFSVSHLFIDLYIYLCAANFMHNINIIHRSFFPSALPCLTGCLSFSLPFLSLPCLFPLPFLFPWPAHAYFLLPMPTSYAYFLCLLPVSLPCLLLCPAYFLALPISCLFPCPAYFLLPFLALPVSLPCLILITFPCPACFLALPNSLPCLFPWPGHAYFLLLCLFLLPVSLPYLLLCPAYFLSLPFSLPCLLPCLTYRSTFFMSACCTGI